MAVFKDVNGEGQECFGLFSDLKKYDLDYSGEDAHHHLRFNDVDSTQLVSSGKHSIVFWKWDRAESCLIPDRPQRGIPFLCPLSQKFIFCCY